MADPIDFYFDFSSPYGYLASTRIDEVAARHGRTVHWRPILLGAVFKVSGASPLIAQPLKGDYARRDLARHARRMGEGFQLPEPFPFAAIAVSRVFYWLAGDDPERAVAFAKAVYNKSFVDGANMADQDQVRATLSSVGGDYDAAQAALADPEVKNRLRVAVEQAIEIGVCGSPYFIVDGEPFWGVDRLPDLEAWLETGGW